MYSRSRNQLRFADCGLRICTATVLLVATILFSACVHQSHARSTRKQRVCADPNNLPFSNERREGFENKIAELLAVN
jgi:hypothetical protein